jgi:hypothetical protein
VRARDALVRARPALTLHRHGRMKSILLLAVGLAAGYTFGFKDAQTHDSPIVTRLVEQAGGSARGKYSNDIDGLSARMDK